MALINLPISMCCGFFSPFHMSIFVRPIVENGGGCGSVIEPSVPCEGGKMPKNVHSPSKGHFHKILKLKFNAYFYIWGKRIFMN